jgi:hypothetical protein
MAGESLRNRDVERFKKLAMLRARSPAGDMLLELVEDLVRESAGLPPIEPSPPRAEAVGLGEKTREGAMTVGELRKRLDGVDDALEIVVRDTGIFDYCGTIATAAVGYVPDTHNACFVIDCVEPT